MHIINYIFHEKIELIAIQDINVIKIILSTPIRDINFLINVLPPLTGRKMIIKRKFLPYLNIVTV